MATPCETFIHLDTTLDVIISSSCSPNPEKKMLHKEDIGQQAAGIQMPLMLTGAQMFNLFLV